MFYRFLNRQNNDDWFHFKQSSSWKRIFFEYICFFFDYYTAWRKRAFRGRDEIMAEDHVGQTIHRQIGDCSSPSSPALSCIEENAHSSELSTLQNSFIEWMSIRKGDSRNAPSAGLLMTIFLSSRSLLFSTFFRQHYRPVQNSRSQATLWSAF